MKERYKKSEVVARFRWFGRVMRREEEAIIKAVMYGMWRAQGLLAERNEMAR